MLTNIVLFSFCVCTYDPTIIAIFSVYILFYFDVINVITSFSFYSIPFEIDIILSDQFFSYIVLSGDLLFSSSFTFLYFFSLQYWYVNPIKDVIFICESPLECLVLHNTVFTHYQKPLLFLFISCR